MNGSLTIKQREYVLFHLERFVEMPSELKEKFVFGEAHDNKICFVQNENAYDYKRVLWIDDLPVLFPGDEKEKLFEFRSGTLIFKHDLLKSAFYLLSGYREYGSTERDELGRFPYEASVQYELGIIDRPIVNEYFEIMIEAISAYCDFHGIDLKQKTDHKASLYLTHDVDRIDKYTVHTVKGAFKKKQFGKAFNWLLKWLNPFYKSNPKWTFDYLQAGEKERGLQACYYFLNKDVKHLDSYYSFTDKRIKILISELEKNGHSIGLHGGIRSCRDTKKIKADLLLLNSVTKSTVKGNRQHRLIFEHPETMRHLEASGIVHDSSLGFAAHEGFRNSYCHPFKLFDHEHERMIDVWEIPLTVMDASLFTYRKLDFERAFEAVKKLKLAVVRYAGVFTLLFHQDFLDEEEHPGIRAFYEKILDLLTEKDMSVFDPGSLNNKG